MRYLLLFVCLLIYVETCRTQTIDDKGLSQSAAQIAPSPSATAKHETPAERIKSAESTLGGKVGVLTIPSSISNVENGSVNQFPANPSDNSTCIDYRPRRYSQNPAHVGVNITDCKSESDWVSINSGGLSRARLYVGNTSPSGTFPGEAGGVFSHRTFGGKYQDGAVADNGIGAILTTSSMTDTIGNRAYLNGLESEASIAGRNLGLYRVTASTHNVIGGSFAPQGTVGNVRVVQAQGSAFLPASGLHIAKWETLAAEWPALHTESQNVLSGSVRVKGSQVTLISGDRFADVGMDGYAINLLGRTEVVEHVTDATHLTLRVSGKERSGEGEYQFIGNQYSAHFGGNTWIQADRTLARETGGGGGLIIDTNGRGTDYQAMVIRDTDAPRLADGTFLRTYLRNSNGTLQFINRDFTTNLLTLDQAGNVEAKGSVLAKGEIISKVAEGRAPLVVESATPVEKMVVRNHPMVSTCGRSTECAPVMITDSKIIFGTTVLKTETVKVSGLTFTGPGTFVCIGTDQSATNAVKIVNLSASDILISGTSSDTIGYQCVGR